jgi:hypothetical protein
MGLFRNSSLASLALLFIAANGSAQPAAGAGADACRADAQRLCGEVEPGGGRLLACLANQLGQLSPTCRSRVEPVRDDVRAWRAACGADIDAKCGNQALGVELGRCLERHERDLAPACRVKVSAAPAYLALACGEQVAALCPGAGGAEGRYLACLDAKATKLTPPCAEVFEWYAARYQKACAPSVTEHCGGDPAYDRSYPCLQKHERQLPFACQKLVATPAGVPPSGATPLGDGPFAGYYASNWGLVSCEQQRGETKVDCRYEHGAGTLGCVANRNTLVCRWREGAARGRATLVKGKGGHLVGTWGHDQRATGGGPWVLARVE